MYEVKSLGIFVGQGKCNAHCAHCAGVVHRKYAPKKDGIIDKELIYKTLKYCYSKGARSLSITSSGEPTLSPLAITKALNLVYNLKKENINYTWINLYSNGIRIGEDKEFCKKYLSLWKDSGLKTIYITVHNINEKKNAKLYNIKKYPPLERIVSRIHNENILTRANLVLSKNNIDTSEKFVSFVKDLRKIGFDHISAWSIRNLEDKVDLELSPNKEELDKMEYWIEKNKDPKCRIRLLRENSRILYESGKKLTLFPDGKLTNSWCN
ncbi:MAG: radical SAM protein [Candidatus Nanoarchaeia archaeon]|nr:radical SAM protein [Candidatus Nanoarchaeia archaeon]MDD5587826.1 radical SAM protein [Candidatus Nanoarchaeia archaeon]